jgi:hypothetical protein
LNDALDYAAQKGTTAHDKIKAVELAKLINLQCGGAIITPWDVDQLDEEWIDVFKGLSKLPSMRENYQAFNKRLAQIRAQHPNYRKYLT